MPETFLQWVGLILFGVPITILMAFLVVALGAVILFALWGAVFHLFLTLYEAGRDNFRELRQRRARANAVDLRPLSPREPPAPPPPEPPKPAWPVISKSAPTAPTRTRFDVMDSYAQVAIDDDGDDDDGGDGDD